VPLSDKTVRNALGPLKACLATARREGLQRWLGHHSASFTLDTYVHLLDNDLGEPLKCAVHEG
jgi:hypothetical protein